MLPGISGFDGPFGVEVVGQRDVDGVDVGNPEQRLIRIVRSGNAPTIGLVARDPGPPAGDAEHLRVVSRLRPWNQRVVDGRAAHNAPPNASLFAHWCPSCDVK